MSSNIVSLGFLVSQNCTLMDFLPGADTMASHSKCMLMRSGHVLKRILVSDFLSPMESQIAFGSADIEAMEGEAFMPQFERYIGIDYSGSGTPGQVLLPSLD